MIQIGSGQNKVKSIAVDKLSLSVIFFMGYLVGYYNWDFSSKLSN